MEEIPKIKKPRKRVKDFYPSDVIERTVTPILKNNTFWQKENALFKKLFTKYPDKEFWKKVKLKPVPSLAIYMYAEAEYLKQKFQEFNFQPEVAKEEIKLGDKIGEDYNLKKKPKTLKDFLK
jgi:hypothetical protein